MSCCWDYVVRNIIVLASLFITPLNDLFSKGYERV